MAYDIEMCTLLPMPIVPASENLVEFTRKPVTIEKVSSNETPKDCQKLAALSTRSGLSVETLRLLK